MKSPTVPYDIWAKNENSKRKQIRYFNFRNLKMRIRQVPDGFITEYTKTNFFGCKKWIPLITYRGSDEAFPYKTMENAFEDTKRQFAEETTRSFNRIF